MSLKLRAKPLYDVEVNAHPFGGVVLTGNRPDGSRVIEGVVYIDRNTVGTDMGVFKARSFGRPSIIFWDGGLTPHYLSPRARKAACV